MIYRELCKEKVNAKKELCTTIEQSSLSDSQKHSLLDVNNNITCLGTFTLDQMIMSE